MPFYNVEHSFPLSAQQKSQFAEKITDLHARTFTTPSMFVQVKYDQQDASDQNHFVGGQINDTATNRIIAYVRSSPERKQEHFDKLADQIENAWYVVLGERTESDGDEQQDKQAGSDSNASQTAKAAKELLSIGFVPGLSGREKGFVIPQAGKEEAWIKQYRKQFQHKADMGDESFKSMLQEIEERDDLKHWRA